MSLYLEPNPRDPWVALKIITLGRVEEVIHQTLADEKKLSPEQTFACSREGVCLKRDTTSTLLFCPHFVIIYQEYPFEQDFLRFHKTIY